MKEMSGGVIVVVIPGRAAGAGPESIARSAAEYGFRVRSLTLAPRNDELRVLR